MKGFRKMIEKMLASKHERFILGLLLIVASFAIAQGISALLTVVLGG